MRIDEGFRVLSFTFEKRRVFQRISLKSESVGSEVRNVCFCISVFSKNVCNSEEGTNKHNINDIGGARYTFKA